MSYSFFQLEELALIEKRQEGSGQHEGTHAVDVVAQQHRFGGKALKLKVLAN